MQTRHLSFLKWINYFIEQTVIAKRMFPCFLIISFTINPSVTRIRQNIVEFMRKNLMKNMEQWSRIYARSFAKLCDHGTYVQYQSKILNLFSYIPKFIINICECNNNGFLKMTFFFQMHYIYLNGIKEYI